MHGIPSRLTFNIFGTEQLNECVRNIDILFVLSRRSNCDLSWHFMPFLIAKLQPLTKIYAS
jgi:hypothetical protein